MQIRAGSREGTHAPCVFHVCHIYDIIGLSDNYINVYANYLANHRLRMTRKKKMQYLLRRAQRSTDGGMVEFSPADHVISVMPCSPLILSASSRLKSLEHAVE